MARVQTQWCVAERNAEYAEQLGWGRYRSELTDYFDCAPEDEDSFAQCIRQWQVLLGPRLNTDGVLGPETWGTISEALGLVETTHLEHHPLEVRGRSIDFYIFVDTPNADQKLDALRPVFERMPEAHLDVLYPVFIMEKKPGGRDGGGTWRPNQVASNFRSAAHERNTGVPNSIVDEVCIRHGRGMMGLSRDRWERSAARLPFTIMHEVGHCVDYSLGLVANGADFRGMETDRCGAGSATVRRAVEAYARWICRPSRIFHTAVSGENAAQTNQRLLATLRRSPAFNRRGGPSP